MMQTNISSYLLSRGIDPERLHVNNPQQLKPWFKATGKLVIALNDNDEAGSKLSRIADINYTIPDPYNDLGDMKQEEVNEFLSGIIEELNLS